MFDVSAWLDRARARVNPPTDYRLAKTIGVTSSAMSWYRSGKRMPDDAVILRLCALSGDDPEHVAACIQSMRAANDDVAGLWRRVAERLKSGGVASIAVTNVAIALAVFAALPDQAHAAAAADPGLASAGLYIMSNALRRLVMRLCATRFRPARDLPGAF